MNMFSRRFTIAVCAGAFVMVSATAYTQMRNEPYTFRNAPNGMGMSIGGQQAILNERLFGETPRNLVRGPSGQLLDVTRGPGHSAIVSFQGNGGIIPGYKGADYRQGNAGMAVGVFNSFFTPSYYSGTSYASYAAYGDSQTGAIVSSWTSKAMSDYGPAYSGSNSIEGWTGMVPALGDR